MKSLSGVEKIIFRALVIALLVIALLTIGSWNNVPRSEATASPRHYPIQVLRLRDGRVARSLMNQMVTTNWSGYVAASFRTGQNYTSAQGTWVVLQSLTFLVSQRNTLHPGSELVDFARMTTAQS